MTRNAPHNGKVKRCRRPPRRIRQGDPRPSFQLKPMMRRFRDVPLGHEPDEPTQASGTLRASRRWCQLRAWMLLVEVQGNGGALLVITVPSASTEPQPDPL